MSKKSPSEVIAVVEKALEMKPGILGENTRAEEVDMWDSVGQLSILVALDKLFDGKIANINEMAEADSMPKIMNILRQHSLL
jgi:acyl carrier protein